MKRFNAMIKLYMQMFKNLVGLRLLKLLGVQSFGAKDGNTIKGTNRGNELKNNYNK